MEMERTSDELRRGADAAVDPYSVFSWALPVSPLVASSLSVLSYTLSPAVGPYEGGFYLAFFSAALAGFLSAMLASRASRAVSKVLCVIDALVLECAFVFFMLGWPTTQPPSGFTWAGVVMTGFSAASMLMLWLPYRPSSVPACGSHSPVLRSGPRPSAEGRLSAGKSLLPDGQGRASGGALRDRGHGNGADRSRHA